MAREITDPETLTQCGTRRADGTFRFWNRPRDFRDPPEVSLSLLLGSFDDPGDAAALAFGRSPEKRDATRETTASALKGAGFTVAHTPNPRNPDHVSVYWDGDWDDDVGTRFNDCFGEPRGGS